jgi:hypothetical protein
VVLSFTHHGGDIGGSIFIVRFVAVVLVSSPRVRALSPYSRRIPKKVTGFQRPSTCSGDSDCPLLSKCYNVKPRIAKNLLFSCAELGLHDGTNVVRHLDE